LLGILSILLLVILIIARLTRPGESTDTLGQVAKVVEVYRAGVSSKVTYNGQVEKAGVVKILSQTAGIVNAISVVEGQAVSRGALLLAIAANYQGSNPAEIQAAIANRQYRMVLDTFDTQKEIIVKQKEIASKAHDNTVNLATISAQAREDTTGLINLNQTMLDALQANLSALQANNPGNVNGSAILQIQGTMAQVSAGQNQLKSALRNLDYQVSSANPPLQLADQQRSLTFQQLELQQKSLELNRDISALQAKMANISASSFKPTAPFAGKVDRVYVRRLQAVSPGMPLVSLAGGNRSSRLVVRLPKDTAVRVSNIEPSTLRIDSRSIEILPLYVSSEATDGSLYSVVYSLPEDVYPSVTEGDSLQIDIPLSSIAKSIAVPLEAVFQTQDSAYVFTIKDGKARASKVSLGKVSGKFIDIVSGITADDVVILDRTVAQDTPVVSK